MYVPAFRLGIVRVVKHRHGILIFAQLHDIPQSKTIAKRLIQESSSGKWKSTHI